MRPATRPAVIAFDAMGTLFSLERLGRELSVAGLPASALRLWFAHILRDGFALELAGKFKPFDEVALAALKVLAADHGMRLDGERLRAVHAAFGELEPFADVPGAVRSLSQAGCRLAILTNGNRQSAQAALERSGLEGYFERIVSIEEAGHWKPAPHPYRYAASVCGAVPADMLLVAAHGWDVQGAKAAGLRTAWVARSEKEASAAMEWADMGAGSLDGVAGQILGLPAPEPVAL